MVGIVVVSHSSELARGLARPGGADGRARTCASSPRAAPPTASSAPTRAASATRSAAPTRAPASSSSATSAARSSRSATSSSHAPTGTCKLIDAPIVEGAVAAAVMASAGSALDDVVHAARGGPRCPQALRSSASSPCPPASTCTPAPRPSSSARRSASPPSIAVAANGREANAKSLLAVLALGATAGTPLRLTASGEDAAVALDALGECVARFA